MTLPVVHNNMYSILWPEKHRFPMYKFNLLYELLIKDEIISKDRIYIAAPFPLNDLINIHDKNFVESFVGGKLNPKAIRKIGLPWTEQLVDRTLTALGGSLLSARLALKHGLACNTAGGTHHAFKAFGSGFCIFNDLAVVSSYLVNNNTAKRILIIDLDVHQGDGTASMLENEPDIFTFSVHCEKNFPFVKQKSDLDIPLKENTGDEEYLKILGSYLPDVLSAVNPDLIIYDAGVDPHKDDPLGKLSLTNTGLLMRDTMVLESCLKKSIPVSCIIGGGYSKDKEELVYRHSIIHRAAKDAFYKFKL